MARMKTPADVVMLAKGLPESVVGGLMIRVVPPVGKDGQEEDYPHIESAIIERAVNRPNRCCIRKSCATDPQMEKQSDNVQLGITVHIFTTSACCAVRFRWRQR